MANPAFTNRYNQADPDDPSQAGPSVGPGGDPNATGNRYAEQDPNAPTPSFLEQGQRATGLFGRAAVEALTGLPTMAMNLGVGTRNVLGDLAERTTIAGQRVKEDTPDYELPGTTWEKTLTQAGFPEPQGWKETLPSMGISAILGGKLPLPYGAGDMPEVPGAAPAGFEEPSVTAAKFKAEVLRNAQKEPLGMVVPPSTTNPSFTNRMLETIAGKENVQNWTRRVNDLRRQQAGNLTLGQHPDTPLTPDSMDAIMADAGQAYEGGRAIPLFRTSDEYLNDMARIEKDFMGANESFPGAQKPEIADLINTYLQPTMTGNAGVSAVKMLRTKASDAFAQGNSEAGRIYRELQESIEDELERGAKAKGMPNTIQQLRDARVQYAKAATIKDAMEPDGTITGPGLARAWNRRVPMTGPLMDAAEFARQFPKANLSSSASGSPVHHLTAWGPFVGAGAGASLGREVASTIGTGHTVLPIAGTAVGASYPLIRAQALRSLMSPRGQARAIPDVTKPPSPYQWQISPQSYAAGLQAMQGQNQ